MIAAAMAMGCADEKHMDPHVLDYNGCASAPVCEAGCVAGPADPPLFGDGVLCPISIGLANGMDVAEYDGQFGACATIDTIKIERPDGTTVSVPVTRWYDVDVDRCH